MRVHSTLGKRFPPQQNFPIRKSRNRIRPKQSPRAGFVAPLIFLASGYFGHQMDRERIEIPKKRIQFHSLFTILNPLVLTTSGFLSFKFPLFFGGMLILSFGFSAGITFGTLKNRPNLIEGRILSSFIQANTIIQCVNFASLLFGQLGFTLAILGYGLFSLIGIPLGIYGFWVAKKL